MSLVLAIAYLAALCVALAVILAVASRRLRVDEDPRIDVVTDMLPGANCGACGMPGCRAFAEKVVAGALQPGACTVGGAESAQAVAGFLGIDAGAIEKKVARLLCAGGTDVAVQISSYEGFSSCRAAAVVGGGFKGCTYGCLGLADCQVSCTFDAIEMAPNGLPVVDFEKCTACGDCVRACPKGLFEIMSAEQHLVVQCRSILEGDAALRLCKVACTACGLCAADAPGLITMKRNLPVVDLERLELQSPIATMRCPTGAIRWLEEQQFEHLQSGVRSQDRQAVMDRAI